MLPLVLQSLGFCQRRSPETWKSGTAVRNVTTSWKRMATAIFAASDGSLPNHTQLFPAKHSFSYPYLSVDVPVG
jgi:hypothetical protein